MMKKRLVIAVLTSAVAVTGYAEMNRSLFTVENRFPEPLQLELGAVGSYQNYDEEAKVHVTDHSEKWGAPYLRLGLFENLAAYASVPFGSYDPKGGSSNTGIGDMTAGLQFLAYQDLFGYPFIIPHVEARFDTGDKDKGLGDGSSSLTAGISLGSVMYEVVTLIVDGKYKFIDDVTENYMLSGAVIWDLNEQFALLIEGYVGSEKRDDWKGLPGDETRHPIYGQGGMAYKATENLEIAVYGGGGKDGAPTVNANMKVAYSF
jgi:hypothetical protein